MQINKKLSGIKFSWNKKVKLDKKTVFAAVEQELVTFYKHINL